MASVPPTSPPTVEQVIQWLNELSDRQRLTLWLILIDHKKQTEAGAVLGISQGQFSVNYNTLIGELNTKAKGAGFSYPLPDALLKQALINISTAKKEQTVDKDPLKGIKDETTKGKEPPPPAPRNRQLLLGLILGAVLLFGLLAVAGALRNPFTAATSLAPAPTQTARIETHEVTVVVPQTVVERETVLIPQTTIVRETVPVPQTVVVKEIQSQFITVTQIVTVDASSGETFAKITDVPTALATTPLVSGIALPFLDTFDAGPSPRWLKPSGDWNMRNGWLVNTGSRGLMWLDKQAWTDVVVEFDVANNYCRGSIDILLRMQDTANYVGYQAVGCNSEHVYLVKEGKVVKDIFTLPSKAGHHQFEAKGNIYSVYQEGEFKGSGSDNTYTSGSVGVIIDGSGQQLDNFKVSLP
jgi:hypothetical protein